METTRFRRFSYLRSALLMVCAGIFVVQGCANIPFGLPVTRRQEKVEHSEVQPGSTTIRLAMLPSGYTGFLKVVVEREEKRLETRRVYEERVQRYTSFPPSYAHKSPVTLQSKPVGETRRVVASRRQRRVAGQTVTIELPEAGLNAKRETNSKGEVDFHFLEAVRTTGGKAALTASFTLDSGEYVSVRLPKATAQSMLSKYNEGVKRQNARAASGRTPSTRELAKGLKIGSSALNAVKLAYDNYRLVRSGMTISKAFRLTLPTFIFGLIVEEIAWRVVKDDLPDFALPRFAPPAPCPFSRYYGIAPWSGTRSYQRQQFSNPTGRSRFTNPTGRQRFTNPTYGR